MRKVLVVSDACVATGFARNIHHLLEALDYRCREGNAWDATVIGINYYGDPHAFPYPVYPALAGGDLFGCGRLPTLIAAKHPDVVVIQTDTWNVQAYVEAVRKGDALAPGSSVPLVGIVAVDGKNCQGWQLNGLTLAVFWTDFALREARAGGFVGPATVIPLGVDLSIYKPLDKALCRGSYGDPKGQRVRSDWRECFIVGGVNRNQDRKRFDLMVNYFCDWVEQKHIDDAVLAIQSCPTGDQHVDVSQLMKYRGMRDRLLSIVPPIAQGFPEPYVNLFYNTLDVVLCPSQGEGFGLTVLEAMAAGKVCIVSDWAALGDWPGNAVLRIPCTSVSVNKLNVYGGVMDHDRAIEALDATYRWPDFRQQIETLALDRAHQDRFRWDHIGRRFAEALEMIFFDWAAVDEATWLDLGRPLELA